MYLEKEVVVEMGTAQSATGHGVSSLGVPPEAPCPSPGFQQRLSSSVGRRSSSVAPGAVFAMELEISKLKASLERRDREILRLNREVHKLQVSLLVLLSRVS